MGDQQHLRLVARGAAAWNQWRRENPNIQPELSFGMLQGATLRGADLRNASLYCTWLENADLRQADLRGADLGGAGLAGADLSGADLRGTLYLTQTQIGQAHGDEETLLPEGLQRPGHWIRQFAMSNG